MKISSTNRYTNPPAQRSFTFTAIKRIAKVCIIFYTSKYFSIFLILNFQNASFLFFIGLRLLPFKGVENGLHLPEILAFVIFRGIYKAVQYNYVLPVLAVERM